MINSEQTASSAVITAGRDQPPASGGQPPASGGQPPGDPLPTDLRVVLGRLIRRLRRGYGFPLTQASVLGRLDRDGPHSIGALAALESVRPQSMSQTICELEAEGLIERRPDSRDGRRTQVALTARGREAIEANRGARDSWLAQEIAGLSAEDQEILRQSVRLLARLADSG